ncbi:MAG TPA: flagellar biosynthesis protein FlhF, partial [Geobacteraceae bacterium]|nr:flagellar biosynthesis protein FlhF [Geobacteraceae bacterium]
MAEAMELVKAELGPDAMIISSRKERRGGILGFFTKPVFRITATVESVPQRKVAPYRDEAAREESTRDEFRKSMLEPLARELKELRERVDSLISRESMERHESMPASAKDEGKQETAAALRDFSHRESTTAEMQELKKLLLKTVQGESANTRA